MAAIRKEGWTVKRGHPYKKDERHGFIGSQKEGMEIFRTIHPDSPLIIAEAAWQFSHQSAVKLTMVIILLRLARARASAV